MTLKQVVCKIEKAKAHSFCVLPYRATIASFQAVGYEYAVEMTYPDLPEGTSGGLVNFTSQVCVHETVVARFIVECDDSFTCILHEVPPPTILLCYY